MIKSNDYLTTKEVADLLVFRPDWVRRLITKGKIKAEKLGPSWIIKPNAFKNIKRLRHTRAKD
jgi:excisionase family DNA binding protein